MTPEQRKEALEKQQRKEAAEEAVKKKELQEWMKVVNAVRADLEARKPAPDPADFGNFIGDPRVQRKLQELRKDCEGKWFSNLADSTGKLHYVDLVMEGGGTLGVALLGYLYALESVGIRFLNIGGTSAGSITALLLAAVHKDKSEPKSGDLFNMLTELSLPSLLDSRFPAKQFIRALVRRLPEAGGSAGWGARLSRRLKQLRLGAVRVLWGLSASPGLLRYLGLNPGALFQEKIGNILAAQGVKTAADLNARMAMPPAGGLYEKTAADAQPSPFQLSEGQEPRLALIAAEVSTGTKVVFPRMAPLFCKDPENESPARFVRASMSVPFFFRPLYMDGLSTDRAAWKEAGFDDVSGTECTLVDGGIMSNFPISEFHSPLPPRAPTFGVKLGVERLEFKRIGTGRGYKTQPLKTFGGALFNSARETHDEDFLYDNPDYKKLIAYIDTGTHHWLNFSPSTAEQVDLFLRGMAAGAIFVRHFNWEEYSEVRRRLFQAQIVGAGAEGGNGRRTEAPPRVTPGLPGTGGERTSLPPPPP